MNDFQNTSDAKDLERNKLQLAIDNLMQAELEGAANLAPFTYDWAKHKIYEDRKLILRHPGNTEILEEASDDACAAAAHLLSKVRNLPNPEKKESDPIKDLINEGGPVNEAGPDF